MKEFEQNWHVSWNMFGVDLGNIETTTFCSCLHYRNFFYPYHEIGATKRNEEACCKIFFLPFWAKAEFCTWHRVFCLEIFPSESLLTNLPQYHLQSVCGSLGSEGMSLRTWGVELQILTDVHLAYAPWQVSNFESRPSKISS